MPRLSKRLRKHAGWARARQIGIEDSREPEMSPRKHQSLNQAVNNMKAMARDLTEAANILDVNHKEAEVENPPPS